MADQRLQGNDAAAWFVNVFKVGGSPISVTTGAVENAWTRSVPVVPLIVAENLAAALERVRPIIGSDVLHAEVERALAEFRGAHPRQGFDARAAGRRAVEKHEDTLRRLAADQAHPREETTG